MLIKFWRILVFFGLISIAVNKVTSKPYNGLTNRIVNGFDALDGQFPYQISLRRNNYHHCGGSIISKRFILTAAHCVGENFGDGFEA